MLTKHIIKIIVNMLHEQLYTDRYYLKDKGEVYAWIAYRGFTQSRSARCGGL